MFKLELDFRLRYLCHFDFNPLLSRLRSNENFFNLWEFFIHIFMNKNKAKYVTAFALKSYESEKIAN